MPVNFFSLEKQIQSLKPELSAAVDAVIDSGHFILGKNVKEFEAQIASYCDSKYAIGVASGTDAILIALKALGVGPGDEVITTPFTFVATVETIVNLGARPVFVDIDEKTFNIDPDKIEPAINKKTKAILPVHLYGQPADMARIQSIAKKHGLKIIEDSAQAIGAKLNGKSVCSFGDAGCLSLFPTKNLGCFGDGGVVVTNNEKTAKEILVLRDHGRRETYLYDAIGYNSRLDEIQAAILLVRLKHLNNWSEKRRQNAKKYHSLLSSIEEIALPNELSGAYHVFNQYTIKSSRREELKKYLSDKKIGSMVYYPLCLHLQKAYAYLGFKNGDLPVAENIQNQVLSLPIYPELNDDEINEVAQAIISFFKK